MKAHYKGLSIIMLHYQVLYIRKNSFDDAQVLFNVVDHVEKSYVRADANTVNAAGSVVGERGKKGRPRVGNESIRFKSKCVSSFNV